MRIWKATIAAKSAAAYVEVALPFVVRTLSLPIVGPDSAPRKSLTHVLTVIGRVCSQNSLQMFVLSAELAKGDIAISRWICCCCCCCCFLCCCCQCCCFRCCCFRCCWFGCCCCRCCCFRCCCCWCCCFWCCCFWCCCFRCCCW